MMNYIDKFNTFLALLYIIIGNNNYKILLIDCSCFAHFTGFSCPFKRGQNKPFLLKKTILKALDEQYFIFSYFVHHNNA